MGGVRVAWIGVRLWSALLLVAGTLIAVSPELLMDSTESPASRAAYRAIGLGLIAVGAVALLPHARQRSPFWRLAGSAGSGVLALVLAMAGAAEWFDRFERVDRAFVGSLIVMLWLGAAASAVHVVLLWLPGQREGSHGTRT